MATTAPQRFAFRFNPTFRRAALLAGVTPENAHVEVVDGHLHAAFGPWKVDTTLDNVAGVSITGPYWWPKVIGPAHVSLADRGLTFASNPDEGVCIHFRQPVTGADPFGLVHHPSLTVTVVDPEGLTEALRDVGAQREDLDEVREEQAVHDRLHTMTARELRDLAAAQGITHRSSLKKAELVDLLEQELGEHLDEVLDEANDAG